MRNMPYRVFFWLVAGLMVLFVTGCGTSVQAGAPEIALETSLLELGDMPNGEIAERQVTVRNDGSTPLVVDTVTTTCGCTTASLTPMTIPPGESGVLTIAFDSGAHGPDLRGAIMRRVILITNDPAQPEALVDLTATITEPVGP
jgi:hypothetical protein